MPPRRHSRLEVVSRPKVVLIVDDSWDNREMYAEMLRSEGYRVIEAMDGLDGVARAIADPPDVIVMDLAMPRMDGWQAIRRLGEYDQTRSIPIVVLTGGLLDAAWEARWPQCAAFLLKPCLPDDLAAVCKAVTSRAEEGRARQA